MGPVGSIEAREFADTHIANIMSFYFVTIIVAMIANALKRKDLTSEPIDLKEQTETISACTYIKKLTSREREVFFLLHRGSSNKEVSEQLFVSEITVRNHATSIYKKLGVKSRAELISLKVEDQDAQAIANNKGEE